MTKFTDLDESIQIDGFTLTARTSHDDSMGAPWDEHDGHGDVTDWTRRDKAPGELILSNDGTNRRYYDFAAACRTARADGWGPAPYRLDVEQGANGLCRVSAQWFEGREHLTYRSDWCDDEHAARADVYDQLKADVGPRRYAAMAARADFERLQAWCDDQWGWIGVIVTVEREGVKLAHASLWGIESDSPDYHVDVANQIVDEALSEAREKIAALTA